MKHTEMTPEQKLILYHNIEATLQAASTAGNLTNDTVTQCGVAHILKLYMTPSTHPYAIIGWYAHLLGTQVFGGKECVDSIKRVIASTPFNEEELKRLSDSFEWNSLQNLLRVLRIILTLTISTDEIVDNSLDPVIDPQL